MSSSKKQRQRVQTIETPIVKSCNWWLFELLKGHDQRVGRSRETQDR